MTVVTFNSTLTLLGRAAVLAGLLLTGSLGVAQAAAPADDVPSVVVAYGDLDLSTAAGARTLYRRIAIAATQVCPFDGSRDLARLAYNHACRRDAIARAVRDINSPQLAALVAKRAPRG
ncbi:MAG: UrcA family protein [Steroidobacteraceae bacterium]